LLQDFRGTTIEGRRKGFGCNDGELRVKGLRGTDYPFPARGTSPIRSQRSCAAARVPVVTQAVEAEVADFWQSMPI
jgi:hypothetical protein